FEQRVNQVIAKAQQEAAVLEKDGKTDQAQQRLKQGEAEVDGLKNQQAESIASYQDMYEQIASLSVAAAQLRISQAKATAEADLSSGKISEEAYKRIIATVEKAQKAIFSN